jgi:hypothetical protein
VRRFVHRKPNGDNTSPETLVEVLAAAENRVLKGEGKFLLTANRVPVGGWRTRAELLTALERNLTIGRPGPVWRVANEKGLEFACRELKVEPALNPKRKAFVDFAEWGVRHAGSIHYSQARPIDFNLKNLPWTADCSGSTIAYAKAAGLPDPSGYGFSGAGNTDAILRNLRRVDRRDVQLGDLALWAIGSDGKHVAIITDLGADPMLASHGSDVGPLAVRLSAEDAWHAAEALHLLTVL